MKNVWQTRGTEKANKVNASMSGHLLVTQNCWSLLFYDLPSISSTSHQWKKRKGAKKTLPLIKSQTIKQLVVHVVQWALNHTFWGLAPPPDRAGWGARWGEGAGDLMNQLHIWKKGSLVTWASTWASESVELVVEQQPVPSSVAKAELLRAQKILFKTYMIKIFIPQPFA